MPNNSTGGESFLRKRAELSRATQTTFEPPKPDGLEYLPFQKAGIEYCLGVRNALIADPPGLGKSIQAVGILNALNEKRALIICPASLVYNWKREVEKWHVLRPRVEVYTPRTFTPHNPGDVIIFPYSYCSLIGPVKEILGVGPFPVLILDESQYLKTPKALRTKHVLAKNGLCGRAARIIALSGTPIVNRPMEIYPLIKTLCPEAIDGIDQFQFGIKYCAGHQQQVTSSKKVWNFDGASNLDQLGLRLRSNFMVRRRKEDVLKDLPDKIESIIRIESNPKVEKTVTLIEPFLKDPKNYEEHGFAFQDLSAARRLLGLEKVKTAAEYIMTQLDCGHEKIVVFAHHKEVIDQIHKLLKDKNPAILTGETTKHARDVAVLKFQNDPSCRVFIGSVGAAGVGITLTAASYVVFVEFSWVPGENEQAADRAHRIGQRDSVLVDFLVYPNGLDEGMLKKVSEKSKNISKFTQ
jgi:SWI/SNF-related matrix-associated actin-dependent regulator 1 of chromatin subfamily A